MPLEYVHYGCGTTAPKEWTNFDASPTLQFERIPLLGRAYAKNGWRFPSNVRFGDIVKGLPVPASSCKGIYCSHILEHLSRSDAIKALDNTLSYLRSDGIYRIVVPNLEYYCRTYLSAIENGTKDANDVFMKGSYLGVGQRPNGTLRRVMSLWGNSHHLWMWDYPSLTTVLESRGFTRVRRCSLGDSEDPMFGLVEEASRLVNDAVYLEARRS